MTANRRVAFVLPSLNGGGAERAAVTIANALDPAAWQRSMYLFRREGAYLSHVREGVDLASPSRGETSRIGALSRYLDRTRPDIVVAFLSYVSVLFAARWSAAKPKVVFNQQTPVSAFLHDADYAWARPLRRPLFSAISRAAYNRADRIIATSAGVADDVRDRFGVSARRLRIVPNPVDLAAVQHGAAEPIDHADRDAFGSGPTIVAAGRLAEAKDFPLLIDAFARLPPDTDARLVILGEGEHEPAIRAAIARRGLQSRVRLGGFKSNPWRYFARADVFALTSRYEGFGNVLVEAMACGVPVVATASAGTRAIVQDGENGLLVESHAPEAFAEALTRLLADAPLRRRLAAGATASAATYALPRIVREYESLFEELAA